MVMTIKAHKLLNSCTICILIISFIPSIEHLHGYVRGQFFCTPRDKCILCGVSGKICVMIRELRERERCTNKNLNTQSCTYNNVLGECDCKVVVGKNILHARDTCSTRRWISVTIVTYILYMLHIA